jgi:carboxylesterase
MRRMMAAPAHLDPSPFYLPGGPTGILLIHGFTGAPPEMRLVGDYFHRAGLTVSAPLLPGHGSTIEDMNHCKWTDWVDHVERTYQQLRAQCERVFVAGLSMGSLLTLYLAAHHPNLSGAIAYSPATWVADSRLPFSTAARYVVKSRAKGTDTDLVDPEAEKLLWCYDRQPVPAASQLYALILRVRKLLPQLTPPLLVVYSAGDRAIHPASAERTVALAGSKDKRIIKLEESGHVITVDRQWRFVADQTLAWVEQHDG